jgi:methyl-accepting chemotaxis protein
MFSNVRIGVRLALGFSVMLLIMVVISAIAITGFQRINQKVDIITQDKWPKTVVLNDIVAKVNLAAFALRDALIATDPTEIQTRLDEISVHAEAVTKDFDLLEKSITTPEGKATFSALKERRAAYRTVLKEVIDLAGAHKAEEGRAVLTAKLRPLQILYFASVEEMIALQGKRIMAASKAIVSTREDADRTILIALALSLVTASLLGYLLTKSITAPLGEVVNINRAIAEGDLSVSVQTGRRDEIGQLNDSAQLMMNTLRGIVGNLSSTSGQVSSAAKEHHANASQMATASEEVASQAEAVATAGEEMTATSGDIAQNCNSAAEASQLASSIATEGAAVVMKTVDVMDRIAEKVKLSARSVEALGARSDQIGAIVGTIEDIADQTNLLALNAAIEAARAGEQGRGFAVVADEVRALAERTTKATKEIGEMIKNIQNETKGAVVTMEEGVREVESGTAETAKSGAALREIQDQINKVTLQVSQIATAAEEQTATSREISQNIQQMSDVVQQTARGAQDSSQAADVLARLADNLKGIVGGFKLSL